MQHFNELTPAQAERLALLSEECAEVIKAVSKILRHGYESVDPTIVVPDDQLPETNRTALERELGDVVCAMRKLWDANDIYEEAVYNFADEKVNKIKKWLHHQEATR